MRIVFDVTPLSHPRTGVGNYVLGSLSGLAEAAAGKHELVAWAPTSAAGARLVGEAIDGIPVDKRIVRLPFAHAWRTAWSRVGRPPAERFVGRFDALHFSDWMFPPQRSGIRSTMIHDLVPLRFPEWTTPRTRSMHGAKYRNAARTCDLVFVNSRYTGRETEELLGVSADRIRVAHPGVDPRFLPEGERADLGRPYAVTVATLEPRKNLETLLAAHRLDPHGLALAVVGGEGWGSQPDVQGEDVLRLGFVAHEELPQYYRGAEVLVVPSRFEGFGMTVVEGMACGIPCVVSSHPSLDEACGDAAVRVDPDDAEAISAGIGEALFRRDELRARGLEHARGFTWHACGAAMLEAFEEAA
jgi:glycosyltransferase involved in cell wall biosynthesis